MQQSDSRAVYLLMTGEAVLREYEDHELQELSEENKAEILTKESGYSQLSHVFCSPSQLLSWLAERTTLMSCENRL